MAASAGLMALDPKGELRQQLHDAGLSYHSGLIQAFAAFHRGSHKPALVTGGPVGSPTPDGGRQLKDILYAK